jgi:predicted AAA+ superfamily ATPase
MKYSELKEIARAQKARLERRDLGVERLWPALPPETGGQALVVSGIRRCGKSTLLCQLARRGGDDFFYVNFDDVRLAEWTAADFRLLDKAIGESGARRLFFDEIQTAEKWEPYVRQKLDEGYQAAVAGSNASLLSRELGTKLTGRHVARELFPFSYGEYRAFSGREAGPGSLESYLARGGLPEYLKTGDAELVSRLQTDILYRDIAARYGIRDVSSLRRLYGYLVSNPAQAVSPSRLTQAAGVKSPTTVLEYIGCFQAAYLLELVPCFARSAKAQSLAPKKVYLGDLGIINTGSAGGAGRVALLENCVYNQLRAGGAGGLCYFAGAAGGECDFIVAGPGGVECVQVCAEPEEENQDREIKGLLEAMEFFNRETGIMLTFNTEDIIVTRGKRIEVIPVWKWAA